MTASVIPNLDSPVAAVLIDPTTGNPYVGDGSAPVTTTLAVSNINSPLAVIPVDAATGLPT